MNIATKLQRIGKGADSRGPALRIYSELRSVYNLSAVRGHIYDGVIDGEVDQLLERQKIQGTLTLDDAYAMEQNLSALSPEIKAYNVHCIAHAHIDMNWRWGYQETAIVTIDTMRTMLDLMRDYPEYKFSQSQASVYRVIEQLAPDMLEEIKQRVREGRFEVTASTWVEGDKNMSSLESLIRQTLYTREYLARLLDISPDTLRLDFEPDTFGHSLNLPEILGSVGVDRYYHCRGCDLRQIYRWRAPSGRTMLVYQDAMGYLGNISPACFTDTALQCADIAPELRHIAKLYGVGDHGGGPTRADIESIIDVGSWPLMPTLIFSTHCALFDELEKMADSYPLVGNEEQNFVFTGCYSSQSRIKMANKVAEVRLGDAETVTALVRGALGKPQQPDVMREGWLPVLFSQFHDILPGSGMIETREYALGQFQQSMAYAQAQVNSAMRTLADNIDTSKIAFSPAGATCSEGGGVGCLSDYRNMFRFSAAERGCGGVRAYHIFNPTVYERREPVELMVWDFPYKASNIRVTDGEGVEVPFAVVFERQNYWRHTYSKLLVDATLPPLGYATYIVSNGDYPAEPEPNYFVFQRRDTITDAPQVLENEFIRAEFDSRTMEIVSLTDKQTGCRLIERPAAMFQLIRENPRHGMTSWRVGEIMSCENLNESCAVRRLGERFNDLQSELDYEIGFSRSKLKVTVRLPKHGRGLIFDVCCDWLETPVEGAFVPQLRFAVPVAYDVRHSRSDIPMGDIDRPTLAHDVPCTGGFRLCGDGGADILLCSDSKYAYRAWDNVGSVTLLRSSYDPDPFPELGQHRMSLCVGVVHSTAEAVRLNTVLAHPPIYTSAPPVPHTGALPLSGALLKTRFESDSLELVAVKAAEKGEGVVVRLLNRGDSPAVAHISAAWELNCACAVDNVERPCEDVEVTLLGREVRLTVPAHAAVAVILE